jgi:hypothetical protein
VPTAFFTLGRQPTATEDEVTLREETTLELRGPTA